MQDGPTNKEKKNQELDIWYIYEKPTSYFHKAYQNQSDIVSHFSQESLIDSVEGTYNKFKKKKMYHTSKLPNC